MSHAQSWSLSQQANKSSVVCSVCRAVRQLHNKDGTVHNHGPRNNPCPGSHKPPLARGANSPSLSQQPPPTSTNSTPTADSVSQQQTAPQSQSQSLQTQTPVSRCDDLDWHPIEFGTVKHIPRSARPSCASHLADIFRKISADPSNHDKWIALFRSAGSVSQPPR